MRMRIDMPLWLFLFALALYPLAVIITFCSEAWFILNRWRTTGVLSRRVFIE